MPTLQGFHGGIASHDVYMGKNQVAYAENLHIRDPECVTLGQKPVHVYTTESTLAISCYTRYGYIGTMDGKIRKLSDGTVVCTLESGYKMIGMLRLGDDLFIHRIHDSGFTKTSKIDKTEAVASTDWNSEPSRVETDGTYAMHKMLIKGEDVVGALAFEDIIALQDDGGVITPLQDLRGFNGDVVGVWQQGQDTKVLTSQGGYFYVDVLGKYTLMKLPMDDSYLAGFTIGGQEYFISGTSSDNSGLRQPSGYGKALIAQGSTGVGIEGKEKFLFGRSEGVISTDDTTCMRGDEIVAGSGGLSYIIAKGKLLSWGTQYRGLPISWNYETSVNANGTALDSLGFVARVTEGGDSYIYYSWKNHNGYCGVDKLKVNLMKPDSYQSEGCFYSQKFAFGRDRTKVNGFKVRADTTEGQTIKVYRSIDGGSYELRRELAGTSSKAFSTIGKPFSCYECQFKFVFETDDDTKTPKLYSFGFDDITRIND